MSKQVLALRAEGGDADELHARAAELLRERAPTLRWIASYRVRGGAWDFVDVFEGDEEIDDVGAARQALQELGGLHAEWMDAEASALLRAPGGGGPGRSPGAPGGAPG